MKKPGKDEFVIYSRGLLYMSVCTTLTDEIEIERYANRENPTGLSHPWTIDEKGEFRDGTPMPCPCDTSPKTHKHYLLSC